MNSFGNGNPENISAWLKAQIAELLEIKAESLDPTVKLTRYGMDSVSIMELKTRIEDKLGSPVPDYLLETYSTISKLETYMSGPSFSAADNPLEYHCEALRKDAQLDPLIVPEDTAPALRSPTERRILITGATGFLGSYLAAELLKNKHIRLVCLVRKSASDSAKGRVRDALKNNGLWKESFAARIEEIPCDLSHPRLGLDSDVFQQLTVGTDSVYHCAAAVNWVNGYAFLKAVNVESTRELLRLACCHHAKPFHFISSIGVCRILDASCAISETTDPSPFIEKTHLGYFQSKWVAENLVRQARSRGLPATIYRPSLLSGDSRTGLSNLDDIISLMIKGCIEMGAAPDLDWSLDVLPVDYAANAIVALAGRQLSTVHLINPVIREWREVVLWMNIFGYSVRLLPFRQWLGLFESATLNHSHPLHPLRTFFLNKPKIEENLTYAQLFETLRNPQINADATGSYLKNAGLQCPALNAVFLEKIFHYLIRQKFLPPVNLFHRRTAQTEPALSLAKRLIDPSVMQVTLKNDLSRHSIIAELSSWKFGRNNGLFHCLVEKQDHNRQMMVLKIKAKDDEVFDVGCHVARACNEDLGKLFQRFGKRLGIDRCHIREIVLTNQQDDKFRRHAPRLFGSLCDDKEALWALALEDISSLEMIDSVNRIQDWKKEHVSAALKGLAELHSIWLGREKELLEKKWLGFAFDTAAMVETIPLWEALADHAYRSFPDWFTVRHRRTVDRLLEHLEKWWPLLEKPTRTLIHNDFNPRNLAFRRNDQSLTLCAYDWELAGLGIPQHDLAELLCFVLAPHNREDALRWINQYRSDLESASGNKINKEEWLAAFQASLYDLMLNRFLIYAMIHTFRRQSFLPALYTRIAKWLEIFPIENLTSRI